MILLLPPLSPSWTTGSLACYHLHSGCIPFERHIGVEGSLHKDPVVDSWNLALADRCLEEDIVVYKSKVIVQLGHCPAKCSLTWLSRSRALTIVFVKKGNHPIKVCRVLCMISRTCWLV